MRHFNPRGEPKRAWASIMDARRTLLAERQAMEIYLCPVCHKYHGASIPKEQHAEILVKWKRQIDLLEEQRHG